MAILSINNVSKSFGKHKVLDNVSFHIKEPEIVALVGPNGSGKSTLLNIIANILNSDSGIVEILGKSIRKVVELMDIKHFINKKVKDYSLGMKQQLLFTMSILNDSEFKIKADEIVIFTTKNKLSEIIGKINEVDEIINICNEIKGAERRYEELYKN